MLLEVKDDDASWRHEMILCLSGPVSEQQMLERAQARHDSYAGRLVSLLYRTIFVYSLDLLSDYNRYFAKEYESFGVYLKRRLLLSRDVASAIADAAATARVVVKFSADFSFLQDENGVTYLKALIEPEARS